MATTRITSTRYGADAVDYAAQQGKPHDDSDLMIKKRVLELSFLNCSKLGFKKQMESVWHANRTRRNHRIELYRITQSFSHKELNPHDVNDWQRCNEAGVALAKKLYPNHQVIVSTQADGKGHKLHNHIDVVNQSFIDGKSLRGRLTNQGYIAQNSDSVCIDLGIARPSNLSDVKDGQLMTKSKIRKNMNQQNRARKSGNSFIAELQQTIMNISARDDITSLDRFVEYSAKHGLDVRLRKRKKSGKVSGVSYNLFNSSNKRPVRGTKLGEEFQIDFLSQLFQRHLQKQREQQRIQRINTMNRIQKEGEESKQQQVNDTKDNKQVKPIKKPVNKFHDDLIKELSDLTDNGLESKNRGNSKGLIKDDGLEK